MSKTKVLNLYAGIGGNRKLWTDVDVTAVEIKQDVAAEYQRQHPDDEVIISDAHEFLKNHYGDGYDFVWSSPPCPTHSKLSFASWHSDTGSNANRNPEYPDMKLYQEIIFLQNFFDGDWVVENVSPYYQELVKSQSVGRHQFWSNYHIPNFDEPERDFDFTQCKQHQIEDWLGIEMNERIYFGKGHDPTQVLRNCVHPRLGKHVFESRTTQDTLPAVEL